MDDLPNEIVVMLLRELSLIDLINCRLVCKRFRSLVDSHFRFRELVAFDNECYDDLNHFRCTVEPFDCEHHFQPCHPNFLESAYFGLLFSDLRSLAIDAELADLESLNKFANLERLQLQRLTVFKLRTLSLKRLKNLTILNFVWMNKGALLLVDSPAVERLYCYSLEFVCFAQHDSLKHLLVEEYSEELLLFRNLETLKINGTYSLSELKPTSLMQLTRLKEIHLKCDGLLLDTEREGLMRIVDHIVQPAGESLKSLKLKIFLYGIELDRPFNEYGFDEDLNTFQILEKQFDNYAALGHQLNYQTKIYYNDLLAFCPERRLPGDLFRKFSNIRILSAGPIFDPDQFVVFVNSCRNLVYLEFDVAELEKTFFERLAPNPHTLYFLILKGDLKGDSKLNYAFCGRLPLLWKIKIYQNLEFDFVFELLKRLKYLRYFSFKQNGEQLITGRTNRSTYYLERFLSCSMVERTGLGFDQLLDLCNSIENKVTK